MLKSLNLLLLLFALTGCFGPDKHDENTISENLFGDSGSEAERNATYYVHSPTGQGHVVERTPVWGLVSKKTYTYNACINDKRTKSQLVGQYFTVFNEQGHAITRTSTDRLGCLAWNEDIAFNFMADPFYVAVTRYIQGEGIHKGKVPVRMAVNPWSGLRGGNAPKEVVDLDKDKTIEPMVIKDPKAIDEALNGAYLETAPKQIFIDHYGLTLMKQMAQKDGFDMDVLIKIHPKVELQGYTKNSKYVHTFTQGKFKIKADIIAEIQDRLLPIQRFKLLDFPAQEVSFNREVLTFQSSDRWMIDQRKGTVKTLLKLDASDLNGVKNFQGFFHLGHYAEVLNSSNVELVNDIDATDYFDKNYDNLEIVSKESMYSQIKKDMETDYKEKLRKLLKKQWPKLVDEIVADADRLTAALYQLNQETHKDYLDKVMMYDGISIQEPYKFSMIENNFDGIVDDLGTLRTIKYRAKTCITDGFTRDKVLYRHFWIKKASTGEIIKRETDGTDGCIRWDETLTHYYYRIENLFKHDYFIYDSDPRTADTSKIFVKEKATTLNPWDWGWLFSRDVLETSKEDTAQLTNRKGAPPSQLWVDLARYQTIGFNYVVDKFLNLHVKKEVILTLAPKVMRYSSLQYAKDAQRPLRDGLYLLKIALHKNYLDPSKANTEVNIDPNDPTRTYIRVNAGEGTYNKYVDYVEKVVQVEYGLIITPVEFRVSDLRLMRIRKQLVVQLETIKPSVVKNIQKIIKGLDTGNNLSAVEQILNEGNLNLKDIADGVNLDRYRDEVKQYLQEKGKGLFSEEFASEDNMGAAKKILQENGMKLKDLLDPEKKAKAEKLIYEKFETQHKKLFFDKDGSLKTAVTKAIRESDAYGELAHIIRDDVEKIRLKLVRSGKSSSKVTRKGRSSSHNKTKENTEKDFYNEALYEYATKEVARIANSYGINENSEMIGLDNLDCYKNKKGESMVSDTMLKSNCDKSKLKDFDGNYIPTGHDRVIADVQEMWKLLEEGVSEGPLRRLIDKIKLMKIRMGEAKAFDISTTDKSLAEFIAFSESKKSEKLDNPDIYTRRGKSRFQEIIDFDSGLSKRAFVGPVTFLYDDNAIPLTPTDRIRVESAHAQLRDMKPLPTGEELEDFKSRYQDELDYRITEINNALNRNSVANKLVDHLMTEKRELDEKAYFKGVYDSKIAQYLNIFNLRFVSFKGNSDLDSEELEVPVDNLSVSQLYEKFGISGLLAGDAFDKTSVGATSAEKFLDFFNFSQGNLPDDEYQKVLRLAYIATSENNLSIEKERWLKARYAQKEKRVDDYFSHIYDRPGVTLNYRISMFGNNPVPVTSKHKNFFSRPAGLMYINGDYSPEPITRLFKLSELNNYIDYILFPETSITEYYRDEDLDRGPLLKSRDDLRKVIRTENMGIDTATRMCYIWTYHHYGSELGLTDVSHMSKKKQYLRYYLLRNVFKNCIKDSYENFRSVFSFSRHYRVDKTGTNAVYYGGKSENLNVGSSFSASTRQSVDHDRGIGYDVGGDLAKLFTGAVGLKLKGGIGASESKSVSGDVSVSTSAYLAVQKSSLDISFDEYEKCATIRMLPSYSMNNLFISALKKYFPSTQADKLMNKGYFVCTGETEKSKVKTKPYREHYFYLTQHFTQGDMQDPGDLRNHAWLLSIRGERDFSNFVELAKGVNDESQNKDPDKKIFGKHQDWALGMIDGGIIKDEELIADIPDNIDIGQLPLNQLVQAYKNVIPNFPGLYTVTPRRPDHPEPDNLVKTNPWEIELPSNGPTLPDEAEDKEASNEVIDMGPVDDYEEVNMDEFIIEEVD